MKKIMFYLVLLLMVLLVACNNIDYVLLDDLNYRITEEDFNENLIIDYGAKSLVKHEVYLKDDLLEAQFYFDQKPTKSNIEALTIFVTNQFIFQKVDNYRMDKYDEYIINKNQRPLAKRFSIVFITDNQINQATIYDENLKIIKEIK